MRLNKPISEVELYPINPGRGIWSFLPQGGAAPVRVRVPKGSRLREIRNWGTELSVPTSDRRVSLFWSANEVWRAVEAGDQRFKRLSSNLAVSA